MFIIENLPYLSCFFNMLHYVYVFAFHNFYYTSNVKSQISVIHRMVTGCKPFKPPNFCLDLSLATWRSDFFFDFSCCSNRDHDDQRQSPRQCRQLRRLR